MNRSRFIAIAIIGVIAFGLILSAGESSEEPAVVEVTEVPTESPTTTPEPTPSPEPTATPQPAATSTPTPTPEATEAPTQTPQPTESPTATPEPTPTATPETLSAAEHLKSLVVCGRVTVLASMYWGQAPGLAYAGNPATSGQLQQDDVIQFLMSEPNANGEVRVKVFPHDGRAVGKTNDQVWISWVTISLNRLDLFAFRCES